MIELQTSITSFLGGEGFGTVNVDLFPGGLPDRPVRCTAVVQTGGSSEPGDPMRTPQVTILHRNRGLQEAGEFLTNVNSTILSQNGFRCLPGEISGRFEADSEPGLAGYDDRNLVVFQVQYTFITTTKL
jgi:hypothetical protein